jgi:hypothetical protein
MSSDHKTLRRGTGSRRPKTLSESLIRRYFGRGLDSVKLCDQVVVVSEFEIVDERSEASPYLKTELRNRRGRRSGLAPAASYPSTCDVPEALRRVYCGPEPFAHLGWQFVPGHDRINVAGSASEEGLLLIELDWVCGADRGHLSPQRGNLPLLENSRINILSVDLRDPDASNQNRSASQRAPCICARVRPDCGDCGQYYRVPKEPSPPS